MIEIRTSRLSDFGYNAAAAIAKEAAKTGETVREVALRPRNSARTASTGCSIPFSWSSPQTA